MQQKPGNIGYWRGALSEVRHIRMLVLAALVCAISVVVGGFYVAVGENLRVYFTFFFSAVGGAIYGPILGALVGAVTDTLNFVLFPTGPYFPGYLLSEVLGGLLYGLFLYRGRLTVVRLFFCKFTINYGINVALGSLWSAALYGKGYLYYLAQSLIKNTLLLPFEVIALSALFAMLLPICTRYGLLPGHAERDIHKLTAGRSALVVFCLDFLVTGGCALYYGSPVGAGGAGFLWAGGILLAAGAVLLAWGAVRRRREAK